jgi:hypothetical protein
MLGHAYGSTRSGNHVCGGSDDAYGSACGFGGLIYLELTLSAASVQ